MKLPNFTRPLYGLGEHNKKNFPFLFLNFIGTVLWDLTQKISPTIGKLDRKIRSMKFETVRIHFLNNVLVCCHPEILLPWPAHLSKPFVWSICIYRRFRASATQAIQDKLHSFNIRDDRSARFPSTTN